jgi:hypothetical protein
MEVDVRSEAALEPVEVLGRQRVDELFGDVHGCANHSCESKPFGA